ncbi:hypothetical protein NM688_g4282 [Phlebia brevispora]|uniref:Uncharacterized protein n=1 Tax=Phlebia brevispora TaxID=194682 RepID=A0ACC1T3D8_9APHY|nr:hypothetical protein NM688_g4282 [Phlebia brevispora]
MQTTLVLLLSTLLLFIIKRTLDLHRAVHSIHGHPGFRVLLPNLGLFGVIFMNPVPYITKGSFDPWLSKYADFAKYGVDILSSITMLPNVGIYFTVADPAAIKEITIHRLRFPKPVKYYRVLTFFGRNIVASEFDEWKRFRKIAAPAFSERNNKLVWDETVRIMQDLFNNVWGAQSAIEVDHAVEVTLPIALFVIGVAGFGRRISWKDDLVVPAGHQMAFKDALHIVSTDVFMKFLVPDWILNMGLTKHMRDVKVAFDELESYMLEMIRARKTAEKKEERYDLFSSLLDASEEEEGSAKLTDRELLGNIFIFLLAGHETTAHTLCFTFGLLALYQDEQEKLYQHIKSTIPDGRIPTYAEMDLFTYSVAVFYETLRLFPPVINIPKYSAEDTTLVTKNAAGENVIVPVPQGASVTIHVPGLHYNSHYWDEPHAFKPERFLSDWPKDAFLPFSGGARSCLGRRFFETEGIAILTMLVSRYRIEVKDEPQFAGETFEERKERIFRAHQGVTLTNEVSWNIHSGHADFRVLLPSLGIPGLIFKKPIPYITKGSFAPWDRKYADFAEYGVDILSSITTIPNVATYFDVADPGAIKATHGRAWSQEITTHRLRFPKPVKYYRVLTFFGPNMIASEFNEWKRFRKIAAPAFSERNNKLVWDETVRIMQDLFENVWGTQTAITVDHAIEITLPIALFVIGVAGFGRRISWKDDLVVPAGHQMAFKDALHVVSTDVFTKLLVPEWILNMGFTKHMKDIKVAFDELEAYMLEMVHARKMAEKKEERYDLFSSLLDASEEEEGSAKLTDRELLGNIFVFLLAGHETTAHTLCFTFGLLALYQDEQEKLFQHIKNIIPDGRVPVSQDPVLLKLCTSSSRGPHPDRHIPIWICSRILWPYSTRRFDSFLQLSAVPKYAAEDTTLVTKNAAGDNVIVPVPNGSEITIHVPGLHYNHYVCSPSICAARYWDDPHAFKPERFLGDWPKDAFLPFSGGARSCLGRRFFETEGVAILTMLVSRYRIEVKNEPEFAGETFEEKRERIFRAKPGVTLTPIRVPLVFRRRSG